MRFTVPVDSWLVVPGLFLLGACGHAPRTVVPMQRMELPDVAAPPTAARGSDVPQPSGIPRSAPPQPSNASLVAGGAFTCVRRDEGRVSCCGNGWHGELGNGGHEDEGSPVDVEGIDDAVDIAAGVFHACARRRDDSLWCWGENRWGQLGYGAYPHSKLPREVPGAKSATQVSLGIIHSCARRADGVALCWGRNNVGQAGTGAASETNAPPAPVVGLGPVAEVAVGWSSSCARLLDGTVRCWGSGVPALRGPSRGATLWTPAGMPAQVTTLALGAKHLCALDRAGAIWCGGEGPHGQLCDGSSPPQSDSFPPPP